MRETWIVEGHTKCHRQSFDGARELHDLKTPRNFDLYKRYRGDLARPGQAAWLGGDLATVDRLVEQGWPEGVELIRKNLGELKVPQLPSMRREKTRADFGDEVDMQRVWSGDLGRAWATTKRRIDPKRNKPAQTVTLFVRIGGDAHCQPEHLFWQGAAAVAVAEAMRKSGRACRVRAFEFAHSYGRQFVKGLVDLTLVEPGQQPNLEMLAVVMCHAGYFRTEIFKANANIPTPGMINFGTTDSNTPEILKAEAGDRAFFIENIYDKASCQRFIENVLKAV